MTEEAKTNLNAGRHYGDSKCSLLTVGHSSGLSAGSKGSAGGTMHAAFPSHTVGARERALQVLQRVERGEAVQAALDQVLSAAKAHMDSRDGALCTEMVYGYLRTSLRLGAILASVLKAPQSLPPPLRLALGLSVYSMLFLQRVPDYAAVHWCVEFARAKFGKKMAGLANAVLRSVQRLGDAPMGRDFYAAKDKSALETACLFYAVPPWIGALWLQSYGAEACERMLARSFAQPWPCMRLNALHPSFVPLREELLAAGAQTVGSYGLVCEPGKTPETILGESMFHWHEQGALSWQAAGSLAALNGGVESAETDGFHWRGPVWDCCAGQGGKSLALLERGHAVGLCSDIHVGRLRLLQTTAHRLGLACPPVARMQADVPALLTWRGTILMDAPCSGLGTMARRPEIRSRRTAEHIHGLVKLQAKMLSSAWNILEQGSHIVYMTCTLNPEENEAQVSALLQREPQARLVSTWQTPPHHPWLEGMYVAVVQKA